MSIDTFLLSADTTDLDYPEVRPTLDLNFARVKALDTRITFTRASGGSYTGADGLIKLSGVNEARFDHNPVTGESLGLLVEESRTNLLTYSEQFDNAAWSKVRTSVSANVAATLSPNGPNDCEKLYEDTSPSTDHFINLDVSGSTSATYTASIFIKSAERYRIRFQIIATGAAGNRASAWFDSDTGSVVSTLAEGNGSVITTNIQQYPNGWYRCILTGIPSTAGSGTAVNFNVTLNTTSINTVYTGDGTSGIYVWGAQIEQASFPTSYIPTVGSTRTRAADNASITGKNFSSWYRQDEGSFLVNFNNKIHPSSILDMYLVSIFDSSNISRRMSSRIGGQESGVYISTMRSFAFLTDFTYAVEFISNTYTSGNGKSIFNYEDVNYFSQCLNGGNISLDATGNISQSGFNILVVGRESDTNRYLNGTISRLSYYPVRLSNSQLQTLTS